MEQEREKRNIKLTVRLSQSEYEELQKKCDGQMAVWLRELALGQAEKKSSKYPTVDPDLLRHIARIGNNINQITKALNSNTRSIENITMIGQIDAIGSELVLLRRYYTTKQAQNDS